MDLGLCISQSEALSTVVYKETGWAETAHPGTPALTQGQWQVSVYSELGGKHLAAWVPAPAQAQIYARGVYSNHQGVHVAKVVVNMAEHLAALGTNGMRARHEWARTAVVDIWEGHLSN